MRDLEMRSICAIGSRIITVVYGARSVADLVYKYELAEWGKRSDMKLTTTVDPGGENPQWTERSDFVPKGTEELAPASSNTIAIVCGPPGDDKIHIPRS